MNGELTECTIVKRPPLVVEIIGPAGSGKTTLLRALSQRHKKVQPDIDTRFSKIGKFPFFVCNTFTFLPTYLREYRHSRWFDWRETRSMAYLKAGLHVLGQQAPNNGVVTFLDHGPMYRLAFLREFGPEITTSQVYKRWWASLLKQWIAVLDMLIWLDAPDAILLERIHARDQAHTIKKQPEEEACEVLNRYRTSFTQTIAEAVSDRQVALLRFDTSQESVEQIVDKVVVALDGLGGA